MYAWQRTKGEITPRREEKTRILFGTYLLFFSRIHLERTDSKQTILIFSLLLLSQPGLQFGRREPRLYIALALTVSIPVQSQSLHHNLRLTESASLLVTLLIYDRKFLASAQIALDHKSFHYLIIDPFSFGQPLPLLRP